MDSISQKISALTFCSQRGIGVVFLLSLMPFLTALCLALIIMGSVLTLDQRLKQLCRETLIVAQEKSATSLKTLLQLNPLAQQLRLKKRTTEIAYAAAIASGNKVLALRLRAELAKIQIQREQLDRMQRLILRRQDVSNLMALQNVKAQLRAVLFQLIKPTLFLHEIYFSRMNHVSLAVKPDMPDLAPVYELQAKFEEQQTLSVFWNWSVYSRVTELRRYPLSFARECSVTLTKRKNQWNPLLRTDKLLLKDSSPFSSSSASF